MKKIVLIVLLVGLSGCATVSGRQAIENAIPENLQIVSLGVVQDGDMLKNAVMVKKCKIASWYKRLLGADRCEPSEKNGGERLIVF